MTGPGNTDFRPVPSVLGRCLWLLLLLFSSWEATAFLQQQECISLDGSPQSADLEIEITADKTAVRTVSPSDVVTYTITIKNPSEEPLENIDFEGQLFDGNGEALSQNFFESLTMVRNDFSAGMFLIESDPLKISGNFSLEAGECGKIIVEMKLKEIPARNHLTGRVSAFATGTDDPNLLNNWSSVETVVQTEGKDLMITKTVDSACLDPVNGNTITLTVINVGTEDVKFKAENLVVNDNATTSEATVTPYLYGNWEYLENLNSNSFKISFGLNAGTLEAGASTSFSYHLDYGSGYVYDVAAVLEGYEDSNSANNSSENVKFVAQSDPPILAVDHFYYLQGERADYLSVTGNDNFGDYNWYYTSTESAYPGIKPSTAETGTTTYYVSRSNNGCESELAEVKVTVVGPMSGSIGEDQEACRNMSFKIDGTDEKAQYSDEDVQDYVDHNFTYSYKWESAVPVSETVAGEWITIDDAQDASYTSPPIPDGTSFRRYTILTRNADGKCVRSAATDPIMITTKPCMIGTNPMMPSRAGGI